MPSGWRITAGDMRLTTLLRDDRTLSAETGASLSKVVFGPFVVTVQEGLLDGGFSSGIPPEICYVNVSLTLICSLGGESHIILWFVFGQMLVGCRSWGLLSSSDLRAHSTVCMVHPKILRSLC